MKLSAMMIAVLASATPLAAWAAAPEASASADQATPAAASATDTAVPAAANLGGPNSPGPSTGPSTASAASGDRMSGQDPVGIMAVSNAPVPDTPQNRRLYGRPLSATGRATDPSGN